MACIWECCFVLIICYGQVPLVYYMLAVLVHYYVTPIVCEKEAPMAVEQAWQLVKAYQAADTVGTPTYRFTPYEQAGALIVQFGVFQAYNEAQERAAEASSAGNQASASFWTIVHQVLSTCLDVQDDVGRGVYHSLLW